MKIDFFSSKPYEINYFEDISAKHQIHYITAPLNATTAYAVRDVDAVCVFVNDDLDKKCIEILAQNGVKFIALRSAGFNHVDLKACRDNGLKVVRVPEYSPHGVAEHAMALLLTLNRKTHRAYNRVREGNFSLVGLEGFDLHGKTVGIIGLGKIGKAFSDICHGFGMQVYAYDPCITAYKNTIMSGLDRLLKNADIISLHCPLTTDTRHIIHDKSIGMMKAGVYIINTGRGALIDTQALIQGLKSGKIGAVGLDVYEQESSVFFADHSLEIIQDDILMRLVTFPNVLITSHQGFLTQEALQEIARVTISNLESLAKDGNCINEIAFSELN
ncbi:MAG: 2-hydroxyacid dehydrogenase [Legionellaceae bacterium]|nr:2-hydroxyacid dehydrogenase [Legionellaceae bacterium]